MSKTAKKIISDNTVSLELVRSHLEGGKPFYAYVVIRQTELDQLKNNTGIMMWPTNSIVLYSDYGHDVPAGVEDFVLYEFSKLLK